MRKFESSLFLSLSLVFLCGHHPAISAGEITLSEWTSLSEQDQRQFLLTVMKNGHPLAGFFDSESSTNVFLPRIKRKGSVLEN